MPDAAADHHEVPDIHDVIDRRAISSVFQPLVDLASGQVLGYEALSRGPAGTPWESPAVLFAAARAAGRDSELDWVCRAAAYRAALDAGLEQTLFVNMEPTAWGTPCPDDLAPVVALAQRRLRVVTEMTERAIAADPSGLLTATASCRSAGWGVALDDVGAEPMSLALMPFVHPDVVKLDMHLLHAPDHPHTAHVVAAVAAYAEASGATVLAEGIETAAHESIARTMGATVGQGWRYGRPGALPVVPEPVGDLLPLVRPPATDRTSATPFEIVSAHRPAVVTTKAALMPMSRHLEALARDSHQPPVLLACFQEARHFSAATARRFSAIAQRSPLVAALGMDLSDEPAPGVRGAHFAAGDALRGEWNVLLVGPHQAAALVARDLGDRGPEAERRFVFATTYDRALVVAAARSLLHWLAPSGPQTIPDLLAI